MSLVNHPNFHAVNFTVLGLEAFKKSLRGDARFEAIPHEDMLAFMVEMTERAELLADASAVPSVSERPAVSPGCLCAEGRSCPVHMRGP